MARRRDIPVYIMIMCVRVSGSSSLQRWSCCRRSFSRETKTRFRKELVKSIAYDGVVQKDSLNRVLTNIGRKDRILTDEEFHTLCKEAGDGSALSTTSMMKLFQ